MEKKVRIGINGFGRIGRSLTRVLLKYPNIELVAINDPADPVVLTHLLKHDSIHGHFPGDVSFDGSSLEINSQQIALSQFRAPAEINWSENQVDIVIEASGFFKTQETAAAHLRGSVKRVIISAPPQDELTKTIVLGVNENLISASDKILSNASCTTNCAAPMVKLIDEEFGIVSAYVTTVHSYTTDQKLHDSPHKDLRRARAAALSMVPTTTGAAKALSTVFPHLEGHLGGCGIRVPVPDGSLTDITFLVKSDTSVEQVNQLFKKASEGKMKGILGYTEEPLVSVDILGSSYSCLFDSQLTSVLGKMVKIVAWYDNEMGYSHRLADVVELIAKQ